jgi:hypothetical protein
MVIGGVAVLVLLLIVFSVLSRALSQRNLADTNPTPQARNDSDDPLPAGNSQSGGTTRAGGSGSAPTIAPSPNEPIAKVGAETIYQIDLDSQKEYYIGDASDVTDKEFLDKIARDSAILQGAAKDGFLKLDASFFNSPTKDYSLRMTKVAEAQAAIEKVENYVSGYVVSIWFANDEPPKAGYENAKRIAKQKIDALHADVKSGKITIQQAGNAIRNDTSLADLDAAYKVNAIYDFKRARGEKITISQQVDTALWDAPVRGVTDVFLVQATPTYSEDRMDALYMFGQVTDKKGDGRVGNFDDWVSQQQQTYALSAL